MTEFTTDISDNNKPGELETKDIEANSIVVGAGDTAIRIGKEGIWAGAERFADAPFSVTPEGAVSGSKGVYLTLNAPGSWQVSNPSGILYCHPDNASAVTVKSVSCSYTARDTYGLTFNLEILSDNQGITSGSNFMYFDLSSTDGLNKVWTQTAVDFFTGATLQPGQRLAYFSANPGNNLANFNVTIYLE